MESLHAGIEVNEPDSNAGDRNDRQLKAVTFVLDQAALTDVDVQRIHEDIYGVEADLLRFLKSEDRWLVGLNPGRINQAKFHVALAGVSSARAPVAGVSIAGFESEGTTAIGAPQWMDGTAVSRQNRRRAASEEGRHVFIENRFVLATFLFHFGPRVTQRDRAVEHELILTCVAVDDKITQSFKLKLLARLCVCDTGLDETIDGH